MPIRFCNSPGCDFLRIVTNSFESSKKSGSVEIKSCALHSLLSFFAGDKEIEFRDDYNSDGFIFIKQDQPLPCSVLAIYPTLVTSDG